MSSHTWWPADEPEDDVPHVFARAGLATATGGVPVETPEQQEETGDGLDG